MVAAPVGRKAVWTALTRRLPPDGPALLVISGSPGSGRSLLLSRLGEVASGAGMGVVGWPTPLFLDRTVQLGDVSRALAAVLDVPATPTPSQVASWESFLRRPLQYSRAFLADERTVFTILEAAAPVWVGLDGYSPHPAVEKWITTRLMPRLRSRGTPVVLTVTGTPQQVGGLSGSADQVHEIAALDVQEVTEHLVELGRTVKPHIDVDEARAYAEIVSTNPALLSALEAVLPVVVEAVR